MAIAREHTHGVVVKIDHDSEQLAEALAGERAGNPRAGPER